MTNEDMIVELEETLTMLDDTREMIVEMIDKLSDDDQQPLDLEE